jgi:arylsulfatase
MKTELNFPAWQSAEDFSRPARLLHTLGLAGSIALAAGATTGCATAQPVSAASTKPNIVFILLDNVGWGDFSCYGGTTPTPRVDKLAAEGIRFLNYNVEAQCTPTRAAILTGRMSVRSGTFKVPFPGQGHSGLAPWEYTMAELLSDAGYTTALYGKWHLGDSPGRFPNDQGFDEWWGYPNSVDEAGYTSYPLFKESGMKPPMLWAGKKGQPSVPVMPLDLKIRPVLDANYIVPKTIDFIRREAAAKKPFYVYVGYSEMHPPMIPNPAFAGKSAERGGVYSDLLAEMDYNIGRILDAVKEAGVDSNTIVVVSSDNAGGGAVATQGGSNGPWRGNFFTPPFEGSYRTCAMIRWPGHIPAGVVTSQMLAAVDWYPTLAQMAGASNLVPKDRPIDGIDASAFMLGKSDTTGRDTYMFFGPDGELMSVKWKTCKIIFRYSEGIDKPIVTPQFPMFYDLSSDPHENWNLFDTKMDCGWMLAPAFRAIAQYQASVKKYPNIKPGENFTGYAAQQ